MKVLLVPLVLSVLLAICVFCVVYRKYRWGLLVLVTMLLTNWYWQCIALGFRSLDIDKAPGCLRVMSYNVGSVISSFTGNADSLVNKVVDQDADILFLTEFNVIFAPNADSMLTAIFPYRQDLENGSTACMMYSRLPVIDYHVPDSIDYHTDFVFCCRLLADTDTISVYTGHLRSNNGGGLSPDSIRSWDALKEYLDNYEKCAVQRERVARLLSADWNGYERCIVMGDMNDVVGSPALRILENTGLKNAWWRGGIGYGATKHDPLPYRIDHILYSDGLKLEGIRKVAGDGITDHDALVADFRIVDP